MENTKITQSELFEDYPDVLTVQQVRQALGIGRVGVYKLLDGGNIRCFKIGKLTRYQRQPLLSTLSKAVRSVASYDWQFANQSR